MATTPKRSLKGIPLAVFLGGVLGLGACGAPSPDRAVEIVAKAGRQPGEVTKPRAVAITGAGEMIVIDRTGRVQVFSLKTREYIRGWRLPAWENGTPTGMSVDHRDDTVWIADTHYSRVLHYDTQGKLLGQFGEYGQKPGQFVFITDVVPDPDGKTLWITEYGMRNRIMHFTRDGEFLSEWGPEEYNNADLARPMAVQLSPDGQEVYIVDAANNRINCYDRAGKLLRQIGRAGDELGELRFPYDLALAPDGLLYVLEYENCRVSRFTTAGEFRGAWGAPGHQPGQFFTPWGISIGPDGQMVVADTMNQRLQLVRRPESLKWQTTPSAAGSP